MLESIRNATPATCRASSFVKLSRSLRVQQYGFIYLHHTLSLSLVFAFLTCSTAKSVPLGVLTGLAYEMSLAQCLIAACGGDTVKLFDVSVEAGDPCICQYVPSQGSQVNCVKWNHTNLVVASAGEDQKISLCMKNGHNLGVLPQPGTEAGDSESILAISFSSKSSRYMCSGGTGKVVRIWDMQRKRCIKWLKGHVDTITGVMYNSKDEHLASISVKGDLILHNLASATRATELKDPHGQVLRVVEYSKLSRHILATAGDDGSIHLWDTTGRSPKMSWVRQHSAPTTGLAFSPSNDKMLVSVGLDKKLYTFDPGMKRPVHCIPCEAPFSSLAMKDDGLILAAGTNSGRVVFYDVRGKPQPFTILRAYALSEAVTSLCWQWSNPIFVNEANCSMEVALLGGATVEDSILMPDPLPSCSANTHGRTGLASFPARTSGRSLLSRKDGTSASGLDATGMPVLSAAVLGEESESFTSKVPLVKGLISRFQTSSSSFTVKDDMEVFSPLVDVQPITPVSNFWDTSEEFRKEFAGDRRAAWGSTQAGIIRRFSSTEDVNDESLRSGEHQVPLLQDEVHTKSSQLSPAASTPTSGMSSRVERSPSITPPEAWGGDAVGDKITIRNQSLSRFSTRSSTSGASSLSTRVPTNMADALSNLGLDNLSAGVVNNASMSCEALSDLKTPPSSKKLTAYADKINFPRVNTSTAGSPRQQKAIIEENEGLAGLDGNFEGKTELDTGPFESSVTSMAGASNTQNGLLNLAAQRIHQQETYNQGPPSFVLQLVQRTLEESLGAVQKSIHDDVQNLHLELLRQFYIMQTGMTSMMDSFSAKQTEMMEEIRSLKRENQQLRNLLL